ncbi:MAG TPA: hypothetical protein VNO70_05935 [Blastocatellia bacterium]|nr:hypothetical protein [Blastocatellia bacterium]
MPRGLSELQQFILKRAATRGKVYYCEILTEYFGWRPERAMERYGETALVRDPENNLVRVKVPAHLVGEVIDAGLRYFTPEKIGAREYNRAMATLSRAARRLAARGLCVRIHGKEGRYAGVKLTEAGRVWFRQNGRTAAD